MRRGTGRSAIADVALVAAWATCEALFWPIMPDAVIVPLAYRSPGHWWLLALGAAGGTALGGTLTYHRGRRSAPSGMRHTSAASRDDPGQTLAEHTAIPASLPLLVRPRMVSAVRSWVRDEGPAALRRQPASGVPFKVFAREAGAQGLPLAPFLAWAVGSRLVRFTLAGGLAALAGTYAPDRWRGHGRLLLGGWSIAFGLALWRTVAAWSGSDGRSSEVDDSVSN